ncbi:Pterin-4-alpha-carbinolamine dehydratase [Apiospora arundinis]
MVSLQAVQQSNARIASTLPQGLVALFLGATSGIGQSTLQHFVQNAPPSPRIYSVARPQSVASHEALLTSLRESSPSANISLITADVSLVSEVDRVVKEITQQETKLDLLVMSPGFMAFEGRTETREGLEPSMSTRFYSRQRAVEQLAPLLNKAPNPRVLTVLAGGLEGDIDVRDLDLKDPRRWHFWTASVHATAMHTLALERVAAAHPRLSIVHWFPGTATQEEAGARGLFLATSDRFGAHGGLVPTPQGLGPAQKSGGGIFLADPKCEPTDNEQVLGGMRSKGVDKTVWEHTQKTFARIAGSEASSKDEL